MSKFLKIILLIILIIMVSFLGYFKIRSYQANQTLIPKNANGLMMVNTDLIYRSILMNAIKNPAYYFKGDEDSKVKIQKRGLKIPSKLFLYTFSDQNQTTFFSRFTITDRDEFSLFIADKFILTNYEKDENHLNWATSENGKINLCYNDKEVAVSFSLSNQNVEELLTAIVLEKDFIKVNKSKFKNILDQNGHLHFVNNEVNAFVNFNSGEIKGDISWITDYLQPVAKPTHTKFQDDATATFWMNANILNLPSKQWNIGDYTIDRDSLSTYFKDYMDFEWKGSMKKTDSVITYEYDDDFEKIAIVTAVEKDMPLFTFRLDADGENLKNYLQNNHLLDPISGRVNPDVFPLYPLFVAGFSNQFQIGTQVNTEDKTDSKPSNDFLYGMIDFKKANTQQDIPYFSSFLKSFDKMEIRGSKTGSEPIKISGRITFENHNINAFYQLIRK